MNKSPNSQTQPQDFSLVLGGPLYQLYLRTRLAKPPLNLCKRRIIAICGLAWLPLLLLTLMGGTAFSGVKVPFLFDIDSHTRFLGSLALLIAAELVVHALIRLVIAEFTERDIVALNDRPKFHEIIASALRLRNSVVIEVALIAIAFSLGHWIWVKYTALTVNTWYAMTVNAHTQLTLAGYWYEFVSLPVFQFILLRWYFRLFIWYRFLWQVSKLPLRLNSLHPDKAGGLGFLALSVFAFAPVLLAHTVLLSGVIANRILHTGASLPEFKLEIMGILAYLMLLVFTPLAFFILHLLRSKRFGLLDYGNMASRYVDNFRQKWVDTNTKTDEEILGTADIQSLADLANSFEVEQGMRMLPFSSRIFLQVLILTALPLFPLVFTVIPIESMITSMFKIIL